MRTRGTRHVRHAQGWYAYPGRAVVPLWGKLPCAFGTYSTHEAGTRSPYVQYGGSGTYVSAQPGTKLASMCRSVSSAGYLKLYRWKIHLFRLAMIMLSTNQLAMHASRVSVRPGCGSSRRPRGVSSGSIASPLPSELPAPGVRCILQAVTTASLDDT